MSSQVKFLDLKAINLKHEAALQQAFSRVLHSGWFIKGNEVQAFEKEFAEYIGVKHCIGVANGLDALELIVEAYKIMGIFKEGDEIIVPSIPISPRFSLSPGITLSLFSRSLMLIRLISVRLLSPLP